MRTWSVALCIAFVLMAGCTASLPGSGGSSSGPSSSAPTYNPIPLPKASPVPVLPAPAASSSAGTAPAASAAAAAASSAPLAGAGATVRDVFVTAITANAADVSWTVANGSASTASWVVFGPAKSMSLSSKVVSGNGTHTVALESLSEGGYYVQVLAGPDAAHPTSSSVVVSFWAANPAPTGSPMPAAPVPTPPPSSASGSAGAAGSFNGIAAAANTTVGNVTLAMALNLSTACLAVGNQAYEAAMGTAKADGAVGALSNITGTSPAPGVLVVEYDVDTAGYPGVTWQELIDANGAGPTIYSLAHHPQGQKHICLVYEGLMSGHSYGGKIRLKSNDGPGGWMDLAWGFQTAVMV